MGATTPDSLQRREYKYLVDEATAERIRRYIAGFCELDPYAARTGGRYLTDTLYLDTPGLDIYRATVEDAGDRYKLRIRTYPSLGAGPVFFEVKRRVSESILKTRGSFAGDWAHLLERTDPQILATVGAKQRRAIDNFICHHRRAPMLPSAIVRYEREPYFSVVDDYARVTFDRGLAFRRATTLSLAPADEPWHHDDAPVPPRAVAPGSASVLLELKFTSAVPGWMRHLVQTLGLQRVAFCKYTRAIDALRCTPRPRIARAGFWR